MLQTLGSDDVQVREALQCFAPFYRQLTEDPGYVPDTREEVRLHWRPPSTLRWHSACLAFCSCPQCHEGELLGGSLLTRPLA